MQITEENYARIAELIKWNTDGLVPVVVQDAASREVLMLAYMNREALQRTLAEGRTCFFSRSRQGLWLKGETSGHFQDVVDIRLDCDGDSLLVGVRQQGVACHTGYFSCFHRDLGILAGDVAESSPRPESGELLFTAVTEPGQRPQAQDLGAVLSDLAQVIAQRKREKPPGAYTTYLFDKGLDKILKKVGEEASEVIIAAKNQDSAEIIYEVADLFYHTLVLLEERGVSLTSISEELLTRRK